MRAKFPVKLTYPPSLCIPRNPNAIQPYADVEYVMQGAARLIWKREKIKTGEVKRLPGMDLLLIFGGWLPEPMHPYQPFYR